jgi:hypothetical protein
LREAAAWLASRPLGDEVVVVGASPDAASEQIRAIAKARGAAFGFHRFTLNRLAAELAKLTQVTRNLATINTLGFEALCARVIDRLQLEGKLARLGAVADQPGLPRALARTLGELRLAGVSDVEGELGAALRALDEELAAKGLADRALLYRLAAEVAEASEGHLLLDRRAARRREGADGGGRRLLSAIVRRAPRRSRGADRGQRSCSPTCSARPRSSRSRPTIRCIACSGICSRRRRTRRRSIRACM